VGSTQTMVELSNFASSSPSSLEVNTLVDAEAVTSRVPDHVAVQLSLDEFD
jgi:hypothetical protein